LDRTEALLPGALAVDRLGALWPDPNAIASIQFGLAINRDLIFQSNACPTGGGFIAAQYAVTLE
jgi:hypothetical protein